MTNRGPLLMTATGGSGPGPLDSFDALAYPLGLKVLMGPS
jgi:hypothetical protein